MTVFSGSTEITGANGIFSGSTPIQRIYSGATLVWERIITSALSSADSVAADNGTNGSWSGSANSRDGDLSTYAEFTGLVVGTTTTGTLTLTFPAISASEILEVRLLVKGQPQNPATTSTNVKLASAADSSACPASTAVQVVTFINSGGPAATYDSGLISADVAGSDSDLNWNFDAGSLVGTSATVRNWWAGGARVVFTTGDYNGGGTGGRLHEVQLQVKYIPS